MTEGTCQECGAPRKTAAAYCHLCGTAAVAVAAAPALEDPKAALISTPLKTGVVGSAAVLRQKRRANTRLWEECAGVGLMACGGIILVTLLFPPAPHSYGVGVYVLLRLFVGSGVWAFPLVLLVCGFLLTVDKAQSWNNVGGAVVLFLIFVTWRHLGGPFAHGFEFLPDNLKGYGGYVGGALSWCLRASIGTIGGHIALAALTITALLYLTDVPLSFVLGPLKSRLDGGKGRLPSPKTVKRNPHWRVASRPESPRPPINLVKDKPQVSTPAPVNIPENGASDGTEWCSVCGRAKGYGEKYCPSCGLFCDEPPALLKTRKSRKKGTSKTSGR